ncbi:fibronectin type III domain-containing protein [Cellulosimicrobium marinum]|nr:fibronectin type III domain-containing protein [Cellulosimicrobium marinum]
MNDAPDPSEWGELSAAEIPAGVPDAPAAPTAARTESAVNGGVIGVTWSVPFENGDAVSTYHLQRYKNGAADGAPVTVKGKTSYSATGLDNEASYHFTVVAENKAGKGAASAASNKVVPYGKPGEPGKPSASLINGDTSGKARVTFGAADANGNAVTYDVRANGSGGSTKSTTATSYTFTGLSNGSAYTFDVRACNAAGCSGWTTRSGSVTPYTTPGSPGVKWNKTSATDGYFQVSAPGSDGGNKATVEWEFTRGQSGSGKGTGRVDVGGGYSKTYTLRARACNDAGCSGWTSDSGTTEDEPPPPQPTVYKHSNAVGESGCGHSSCRWLGLHANGYSGTVKYQCWASDGGWHMFSPSSYWVGQGTTWWSATLTGSNSVRLQCYYGAPGQQVQIRFQSGPSTTGMTW